MAGKNSDKYKKKSVSFKKRFKKFLYLLYVIFPFAVFISTGLAMFIILFTSDCSFLFSLFVGLAVAFFTAGLFLSIFGEFYFDDSQQLRRFKDGAYDTSVKCVLLTIAYLLYTIASI